MIPEIISSSCNRSCKPLLQILDGFCTPANFFCKFWKTLFMCSVFVTFMLRNSGLVFFLVCGCVPRTGVRQAGWNTRSPVLEVLNSLDSMFFATGGTHIPFRMFGINFTLHWECKDRFSSVLLCNGLSKLRGSLSVLSFPRSQDQKYFENSTP